MCTTKQTQNSTGARTCRICQNDYPLNTEYFYKYKDKKGKENYQYYCRNCHRLKAHKWYDDNLERASEQNKNYKDRNPELRSQKPYKHDTKAGVYMFRNLITGESYIGCSAKPRERVAHHFTPTETRSNPDLNKSVNTYPKQAFIWGIIEYCDKKDMLQLEEHYINIYKTKYKLWNKVKVK